MGIGPGKKVIEAARVRFNDDCIGLQHGTEGKVISYEIRPDMQNLAKKNLERVG